MTHKKAIKVLRWALNRLVGHDYITDDYGTVDPSAKVNALDMAIEAIEKQMQKKPIIRKTEDYFGYVKYVICPNCEEVEFGFKQPCFCENCGQALDWGESE